MSNMEFRKPRIVILNVNVTSADGTVETKRKAYDVTETAQGLRMVEIVSEQGRMNGQVGEVRTLNGVELVDSDGSEDGILHVRRSRFELDSAEEHWLETMRTRYEMDDWFIPEIVLPFNWTMRPMEMSMKIAKKMIEDVSRDVLPGCWCPRGKTAQCPDVSSTYFLGTLPEEYYSFALELYNLNCKDLPKACVHCLLPHV